MRERIMKLLIGGLKASEIISIVGCTPAYISQLLSDPDFRQEVEAGMMLAATEKKEEDHIDTRYQNTEHKLLTAMEASLVSGEASLGEISRALEVVGKRREAKRIALQPASNVSPTQINIISLTLPTHAIPNHRPVVELNNQQEIIAIDAKPLAPMSSNGVKNLFEKMAAAKQGIPILTVEEAENL